MEAGESTSWPATASALHTKRQLSVARARLFVEVFQLEQMPRAHTERRQRFGVVTRASGKVGKGKKDDYCFGA